MKDPHEYQRGRPEEPEDDAWQALIADYLTRQWGMEPPDVFVVLRECEADEITRAAYLRLAGGATLALVEAGA